MFKRTGEIKNRGGDRQRDLMSLQKGCGVPTGLDPSLPRRGDESWENLGLQICEIESKEEEILLFILLRTTTPNT